MRYSGIPYEALDERGSAYVRDATVIGELPTPAMRFEALDHATERIACITGLSALRRVPFGAPTHFVFGLRPVDAKRHAHASLLMTMGHALSLTYCG
ncbi:hypothetical protein WT83_29105 [Burkholderia territorii]|uniref:Uncharacterized protein n=1 Tax=Burkholderia territorii TaxID=1503055 RepID=A0A119VDA1_9BURK|nr:hypothetical protein WT83_29105 [Burkholderia territorii]